MSASMGASGSRLVIWTVTAIFDSPEAAQAAVAIDNSRLYEAAQRAADERKRLLESEHRAHARRARADPHAIPHAVLSASSTGQRDARGGLCEPASAKRVSNARYLAAA